MEYQELMQAISSVGFPIVVSCACFWMINTTMREMTSAVNSMREAIVVMTKTFERANDAT